MSDKENAEPIDYDHPVAYDVEGRPLYAHPASELPQSVHVARPIDPEAPFISDATKIKHEKSEKVYPSINLSEGEYVITAIRRHFIGLVAPFASGVIIIAIAFSLLFNFDLIANSLKGYGVAVGASALILPIILLIIIVIIVTYISYYIFTNNKMYLTNESIFQTIQTGLFTKREQTISLSSIEDASYEQVGPLQQMLNYGSIRLSTIGEENTYRLSFVMNPKEQIDVLNNAVEAFKNGRPVA